MSLINRKKQHKPFLTARQVAERIGGISAKTVSNRQGITKDLTRYPLGSHFGYCPDEVEALCQQIREAGHKEKAAQERALEPFRRHLSAIGG